MSENITNNILIHLDSIIQQAYYIVTHKQAYGGIAARNESSFQLELGHALKTIGQLYEFNPEDQFHLEFETTIQLQQTSLKSKSKKARIDILVSLKNKEHIVKAAIEIKFFKKANHREPNNRYDVFSDLSNLEHYKNEGIDLCYFILATDHPHYVNQDYYSIDTADFDFRDGKKYQSGRELVYNTPIPYGQPLQLKNSYAFKWDIINDLYFLKVNF